jgi:hypothetical protein|tara:strand:+ start:193 stop:498 length:306 start_codon:yes stop_codon:yes gene_type:complete
MKTNLLETIVDKIEYFGGIAVRIATMIIANILFLAVSGFLIFLAAYGLGNFEGITWYGYIIAFSFGLFGFGAMTWGLFAFTKMWIEEIKDLRKGESFMFNA